MREIRHGAETSLQRALRENAERCERPIKRVNADREIEHWRINTAARTCKLGVDKRRDMDNAESYDDLQAYARTLLAHIAVCIDCAAWTAA